MNVDDLRNPFIVASYQGPGTATDHNGYVKGGFLYVSHYRRGLVVFDASEPEQLREVASFDTFLQPAADSAGTDGAWGVYPLFPSGTVVVSDISNGLFVLRDGAATLGQNAGRIGFSSTTVQAGEGGANARVVVRRNMGTPGAVSVDYSTSDLDATAGSDYTAVTGTLEWAAGEMDDRTITIPLVDDDEEEGDEAFRVTLANPGGGASLEVGFDRRHDRRRRDRRSTAQWRRRGRRVRARAAGAAHYVVSSGAGAAADPSPCPRSRRSGAPAERPRRVAPREPGSCHPRAARRGP